MFLYLIHAITRRTMNMKKTDQKILCEQIKQKLMKPIVLLGMMGSGKTHLGKMLSEALGVQFYDSDHVIEARAGIDIPTIFELYGEQRFRQSEEKILLELLSSKPCVIATGGGAPVNPVILSAIKEKSISVWLDCSVDDIYERIKKSSHRPLLKTPNPKEKLQELLSARKDVYAKADKHLRIYGQNADKALIEMIDALHYML